MAADIIKRPDKDEYLNLQWLSRARIIYVIFNFLLVMEGICTHQMSLNTTELFQTDTFAVGWAL